MQIAFRAVLMAGGMFQLALPAFAQPAELTASLNAQTVASSIPESHSYLVSARDEVEHKRWNAAQTSLERSETILLNNGVTSATGVVTSPSLAMPYIIQARTNVAQHNQVDALLAIDRAQSVMSAAPASNQPPVMARAGGPAPASAGAANRPVGALLAQRMITKALLPGHWQLTGWQYHWAPPDTVYRSVQSNPYVTGHYEYRGGAWIWVAGHYANPTS